MSTQSLSLVAVFLSAGLAVPFALAQPAKDAPKSGAPAAKADDAKTKGVGNVYPLSTCPISGKKLGAMGAPVIKSYSEREVRFC